MSAPVTPTGDAPAARPAAAARETDAPTARPAAAAREIDAPATRPAAAARETIHHPPVEALDLALILRTVGDPLRLQMVRTLAGQGDLLCGALGDELGLPKSTSSYHLRLLREAGLTRTRQAGTQRFVSLRRADLDSRFPGLVDVLTGPSER